MRRLGALHAAQGGLVEAFLEHFGEGGAARIGVVETAVGGFADEDAAVGMGGHGQEVEGGDGVDGVV